VRSPQYVWQGGERHRRFWNKAQSAMSTISRRRFMVGLAATPFGLGLDAITPGNGSKYYALTSPDRRDTLDVAVVAAAFPEYIAPGGC